MPLMMIILAGIQLNKNRSMLWKLTRVKFVTFTIFDQIQPVVKYLEIIMQVINKWMQKIVFDA